MKDIIEIICWFISLAKGFADLFGLGYIIDDITGAIKGLIK